MAMNITRHIVAPASKVMEQKVFYDGTTLIVAKPEADLKFEIILNSDFYELWWNDVEICAVEELEELFKEQQVTFAFLWRGYALYEGKMTEGAMKLKRMMLDNFVELKWK